ncbi:MAG: NfeD family protein [Bacteroidales bacterium]|jgi:membrane protein implicated in regulation of membrane protease activity|nr:NfeD family protein [Bacteroidales bacterium]
MISNILSRPELFWFILGLLLFLFELVLPGFFIFFFGLGAWVVSLICLIANPGINLQIVIFAFVSVLTLVTLRRIIQKKFFYSKGTESADVEDEFTGKEAIALGDFGPGKKGSVEFKGTPWKAESISDINKGDEVIITEKNNFTLIVKPKKQ